MEKLLSIVIPSYNMEAYIERCLDSLLVDDPDLMSALDIIVANDGSTDRTSEIAHSYADRYPDSIRVIDKPNGHYGSCINAALPLARGKYFRILDADDWFDTQALTELLRQIPNINTDVIYTKYAYIIDGIPHLRYSNEIIFGEEFSLEKDLHFSLGHLFMHQLTYKTDFLKSFRYVQTEGICYTDTEYVYYPMTMAKSIYFLDITLYQYFVGRDEQSMSIKALYKNRNHMRIVADRILSDNISENCNNLAPAFKEMFLICCYQPYIYNSLMISQPSNEDAKMIRDTLEQIKKYAPKVYTTLLNESLHGVRYLNLWLNHPTLANLVLSPIRFYKRRKYYK